MTNIFKFRHNLLIHLKSYKTVSISETLSYFRFMFFNLFIFEKLSGSVHKIQMNNRDTKTKNNREIVFVVISPDLCAYFKKLMIP